MQIKPMLSSSSGNCCLIRTENVTIAIDAGASYKKLAEANKGDPEINAILVTHNHGDHISGVGILSRKSECNNKIYMHELTYKGCESLFNNCSLEFISGGATFTIEDKFKITAFDTRHDVDASLGFIIEEISSGKKFGYLTDTGAIGKSVKTALLNCNAYLLEADYDEEELEKTSEYDEILKNRIASPFGHLGNSQVISFIKDTFDLDKISFIVFGHLSRVSNSPEILTSKLKDNFDKKYLDKFKIAPIVDWIEL